MEDVRSLCARSIVVGGGRKLYDGGTDALFNAYQTHKKITVQFVGEPHFLQPEGATVVEQNPHKVVFIVEKGHSTRILAELTRDYELADISIEEDDIGHVVERIYGDGGTSV
jgi:ABC-2 type transport system ATP-binding protein